MDANTEHHPPAATGRAAPGRAHAEPLPEIVFPDALRQERADQIGRLLRNPPDVDCMHVLERSGPLAAAGLYENPDFVAYLRLPPLIPIDGIGNEIYGEWTNMMYAQDREDEVPGADLGDYAGDEDRALFNEWVLEGSSPYVQATIARLRSLPAEWRRIAILDDVRQFGNVTLGVAPAIYKAAYGEEHQYDPANNRFMFRKAHWLAEIVQASFLPHIPDLGERQTSFLRELAKGKLDWIGYAQLDPNDIRSLRQAADFFAHRDYEYGHKRTPPQAVFQLVKRYGRNLFKLHGALRAVLEKHTQEVLSVLLSP